MYQYNNPTGLTQNSEVEVLRKSCPILPMHLMQGLSLFELLIVTLLFALIMTFGLPLTSHWYSKQLAWVMQKDIEQAIEYGMQESLVLGEPLRLMPLHNNTWSAGIMVLRERDVKEKPASVLYAWQWKSSAYRVSWHGFLSDAYLRFTPDFSQSALNGYFLIENPDHHEIKIMVNRVGRVREIV